MVNPSLPVQVAGQTIREAVGSNSVAAAAFQDKAACRAFGSELRAALKVSRDAHAGFRVRLVGAG